VKVDAVRDGVANISSGVKLGQKVVIEGNCSCIVFIGN